MKYVTLIVLILSSMLVHAQTFQKKFTWKDSTLKSIKVEWADVDNDSLLDIIVIGQAAGDISKVEFYKNSNLTSFAKVSHPIINTTINQFVLSDINQDNKIDILVNGIANSNQAMHLLSNKGQSQLADSALNLPQINATAILAKDLDKDGKLDLILAGSGFLKIFRNKTTSYLLQFDSIGLDIKSVTCRDFNRDGRDDLLVSAIKDNQPALFFMKNLGNMKFRKVSIEKAVAGTIESGEIKYDGKFDFVVCGKNSGAQFQLKYYTHSNESFIATDSIQGYVRGELLLADFNSDGLTELSFTGLTSDGNKVNHIIDSAKGITKLDTAMIYSQRWGDFDRDGDLDILRVLDSASFFVYQVWENKTTQINQWPSKPGNTFSVNFFNRTFIYWDKSTDDHTAQKSLTYDVWLYNTNDAPFYSSPQFDIVSKRRILPSHGGETTNNFLMLPLVPPTYKYMIQAIDNSFQAGKKCAAGECNSTLCSDFQIEVIQVCQKDKVELTLPNPVYWFSFAHGFVGETDKVTLSPTSTDTIVTIDPARGGNCKAWVLKLTSISKKETETKYVCQNEEFKLGIEPGWKSVEWKWGTEVRQGDTIRLSIKKDITVSALATTNGCSYQKDFLTKVSIPKLELNSDYAKIKQGESIQLQASGASQYFWTPSTGLSNNQISNPIASPTESISYRIQATDSVGCKAEGATRIDVEETAFIATLFTPNGDEKNDEVKIYGLASNIDFSFAIYTREGSVVFETMDISEATTQGWNGTTNGKTQPAGLYFWKIEGLQPNGQPNRLNGKTKGSILLVR